MEYEIRVNRRFAEEIIENFWSIRKFEHLFPFLSFSPKNFPPKIPNFTEADNENLNESEEWKVFDENNGCHLFLLPFLPKRPIA